jgi:hypothetical protein
MTRSAFAAQHGVTDNTVRRWVREEGLPCVMLGGLPYIRIESLKRLRRAKAALRCLCFEPWWRKKGDRSSGGEPAALISACRALLTSRIRLSRHSPHFGKSAHGFQPQL